jgi:hypothetical protein
MNRNFSKSNYSDNSQPKPKKEQTFEISCDQNAKKTFQYFAQQELLYHNQLVTGLSATLRAFPGPLSEMTDAWQNLWGSVAQEAIDLRTLSKSTIDKWPATLVPFKNMIIDDKSKLIIDKNKLAILYIASAKARLHPEMRKSMAEGILAHYMPQADIINFARKKDSESLTSPIQLLNTFEIKNRRHVQLLRNMVRLEWNDKDQTTIIHTPYAQNPITIQEHNLKNMTWSSLLIRQTPDEDVELNSPWVVSVRNSVGYLPNYLDQGFSKRPRR